MSQVKKRNLNIFGYGVLVNPCSNVDANHIFLWNRINFHQLLKIRIRDYPYNSIILPAFLYEENHIQISSLLDIVVCIYIELSTHKKKKKKDENFENEKMLILILST